MPAAVKYDPGDAKIRSAAAAEAQARRLLYDRARAYYMGRHKAQLINKAGEPNDNVIINLVKQVVDRTVSFLFPEMPKFEVTPNDETIEATLQGLWRTAGGIQTLAKLAKYGALAGTVYARLQPTAQGTRVIAVDPGAVVAFWRGDDHEDVLWYEIHWSMGDQHYRQDIVHEAAGWAIYDFGRTGNSGQWELNNAARWDWNCPPMITWQHLIQPGEWYGQNEVGDLTASDQINKIASDISRILRYHASPRTVGTGFEAEELTQTAIGSLWTIPNEKAQVFNLEMQSDLSASMNYLETLKGAFYAERRVVVLKGDVADFQRVTNLGMRALFIDALAKNEELHRNYERGLEAISRGLLEINGNAVPEIIEPHYADPLPADPMAQVQTLQMERELGIVSQETAARERGRDWTLEQGRMGGEIDREANVVLKAMQS